MKGGPVHTRTEPVGGHVIRSCRVIPPAIHHRKRLGERLTIRREQPVLIIAYPGRRGALGVHKVADDTCHQIGWEAVEIALGRVLDPVPAPVVVDVRVDDFELATDVPGKKLLHPLVLRERDVSTFIEGVTPIVREGRSVATEIRSFVEDSWFQALARESVDRAAARHPGAQDGHAHFVSTLHERTFRAGSGVTKRPPHERTSRICSMISSASVHARMRTKSGFSSARRPGAWIGTRHPGSAQPCLDLERSTVAGRSSDVIRQWLRSVLAREGAP